MNCTMASKTFKIWCPPPFAWKASSMIPACINRKTFGRQKWKIFVLPHSESADFFPKTKLPKIFWYRLQTMEFAIRYQQKNVEKSSNKEIVMPLTFHWWKLGDRFRAHFRLSIQKRSANGDWSRRGCYTFLCCTKFSWKNSEQKELTLWVFWSLWGAPIFDILCLFVSVLLIILDENFTCIDLCWIASTVHPRNCLCRWRWQFLSMKTPSWSVQREAHKTTMEMIRWFCFSKSNDS